MDRYITSYSYKSYAYLRPIYSKTCCLTKNKIWFFCALGRFGSTRHVSLALNAETSLFSGEFPFSSPELCHTSRRRCFRRTVTETWVLVQRFWIVTRSHPEKKNRLGGDRYRKCDEAIPPRRALRNVRDVHATWVATAVDDRHDTARRGGVFRTISVRHRRYYYRHYYVTFVFAECDGR